MVSKEDFAELSDNGLDITPLIEEARYSIGERTSGTQIVPRRIRQEALDDYLGYADEITADGKEKDKRKVAFAKASLTGNSDLVVDEEVGVLYKPNRKKLLGELKGKSKKPFQNYERILITELLWNKQLLKI